MESLLQSPDLRGQPGVWRGGGGRALHSASRNEQVWDTYVPGCKKDRFRVLVPQTLSSSLHFLFY